MQKQPSLVVLKSTRNVMMLWSCDEITTLDQKQKMFYFVFLMLSYTYALNGFPGTNASFSSIKNAEQKGRERERERERVREREGERERKYVGGECVFFCRTYICALLSSLMRS